MNLNLYPRAVQLEGGWVAQVVLLRQDPLMRHNDGTQPDPEVVWESDEAFLTEKYAVQQAQDALVEGARQLFKEVQR